MSVDGMCLGEPPLTAQRTHEGPEVHGEADRPEQRPGAAPQRAHFTEAGILPQLPQGISEEKQDGGRDQNFVGGGHRHQAPPK